MSRDYLIIQIEMKFLAFAEGKRGANRNIQAQTRLAVRQKKNSTFLNVFKLEPIKTTIRQQTRR